MLRSPFTAITDADDDENSHGTNTKTKRTNKFFPSVDYPSHPYLSVSLLCLVSFCDLLPSSWNFSLSCLSFALTIASTSIPNPRATSCLLRRDLCACLCICVPVPYVYEPIIPMATPELSSPSVLHGTHGSTHSLLMLTQLVLAIHVSRKWDASLTHQMLEA